MFDHQQSVSHLLRDALMTAVPLWIHDLTEDGTVNPIDALTADERARLTNEIASHGDVIMFPSKRKGDTARAFNALAKSIAILSFAPGGVTVFGLSFQSDLAAQECAIRVDES